MHATKLYIDAKLTAVDLKIGSVRGNHLKSAIHWRAPNDYALTGAVVCVCLGGSIYRVNHCVTNISQ